MDYINTNTGEYPLTELQVRKAFPNILYPAVLPAVVGFAPVQPVVKPEPTSSTKVVSCTGAALIDGVYLQVWEEIDRFVDIVGGQTKAEQDADYVAALLLAAVTAKKTQIKEVFVADSAKPTVDTGLGFSVDGGRDNLQDFQSAIDLGETTVRAADNTARTVTALELAQIVTAIQTSGLALYQSKWASEQAVDDIVADAALTDDQKIAQINAL